MHFGIECAKDCVHACLSFVLSAKKDGSGVLPQLEKALGLVTIYAPAQVSLYCELSRAYAAVKDLSGLDRALDQAHKLSIKLEPAFLRNDEGPESAPRNSFDDNSKGELIRYLDARLDVARTQIEARFPAAYYTLQHVEKDLKVARERLSGSEEGVRRFEDSMAHVFADLAYLVNRDDGFQRGLSIIEELKGDARLLSLALFAKKLRENDDVSGGKIAFEKTLDGYRAAGSTGYRPIQELCEVPNIAAQRCKGF